MLAHRNRRRLKTRNSNTPYWLLLGGVLIAAGLGLYVAYPKMLKPAPEYQIKQQFIQKNAEKILAKMMGKGNYIVNVALQYSEIKREVYKINYTPEQVTEKYSTETNEQSHNNFSEQQTAESDSSRKTQDMGVVNNSQIRHREPEQTEAEEPEPVTVKVDKELEKLPGLAPVKKHGHDEELPGFPRISPYTIEAKRNIQGTMPEMPQKKEIELKSDQYMPQKDLSEKQDNKQSEIKNQKSNQNKKESKKGKAFFENKSVVKHVMNENKETLIIPDSKIERVYLSLVLNEDKMRELNLDPDDVASIVKAVVGFMEERGDQFYLIVYPFKGIAYTFRKYMSAFTGFVKKYQWFFIIMIGTPVVAGTLIYLIRFMMKARAEQQRKRQEKQQEEALKVKEETQSEINNKKDEILGFAKSKPEDFAKALVDWIEKTDLV